MDHDDGDDSYSSHDDASDTAVTSAWAQSQFESNDRFLFGSHKAAVDVSTLYPDQIQIVRLWQIYLENVDPLLKITHTPTLQCRIIDAASNISNIDSTLQALMMSIFCVSVRSLTEDDCRSAFLSSKRDLLTKYQFGCQEALLNCEFLQTCDRECLTALYLYLVSFFSFPFLSLSFLSFFFFFFFPGANSPLCAFF